MPVVLNWNGEELPKELRSLPRGRYVVEPVDAVPELTLEEEAGIEDALESLRRGEGIDIETVRSKLGVMLGR